MGLEKSMKNTFDRGSAWVRQRFAKPSATGSIPAPVSIFRPREWQALWSDGHIFDIGSVAGSWFMRKLRGPFWEGFKHGARFPHERVAKDPDAKRLAELVILHRDAAIDAGTKLSETREKLIAAQKEISALKRDKQP